jgi:hypothetical protein
VEHKRFAGQIHGFAGPLDEMPDGADAIDSIVAAPSTAR